MEGLTGEELFWLVAVVLAMGTMLWLQHASERQGVDTRGWRMFWTIMIIAGAFAVYFLIG